MFFSRHNLTTKIKDRIYLINLDKYANTGTYGIYFYNENSKVVYFDSFGVKHLPRGLKNHT